MTKINDKIKEIQRYIKELESIVPESIEDYKSIEKKAACERYFEKIVESATDLAFMIIKEKKFRIPEDDTDAFSILSENKVIDKELSERLKEAKGMRNIIVHQYGRIDDELVFEAITKKLDDDISEFISSIEKRK